MLWQANLPAVRENLVILIQPEIHDGISLDWLESPGRDISPNAVLANDHAVAARVLY